MGDLGSGLSDLQNLQNVGRMVGRIAGNSYGYGGYGMPNFGRPRTYSSGGYNYYRNPVRSIAQSIISAITVLIVVAMAFMMFTSLNKPKNDTPRIKIENGNAYDNNCVIDEIGWTGNTSKISKGIQAFWKKTGVQPYIILRADDGTLKTDSDKDAWLREYYEDNIAPRQDAFVYCYFYENGEESTGIPSYMGYVSGLEASSVMDAMAVDTFWSYIDRYWPTDMSMDDVLIKSFTDTGDVIMTVSTTGKDLVKYGIILVITIVIGIVLIKLAGVWFKDRRERAAEDERILNSDIRGMDRSDTQDLEDRYLN